MCSYLAFTIDKNEIMSTEQSDNHHGFPPQSRPARHSNLSNHSPQPRKDSEPESLDVIHSLMLHPALYDPIRRPRYPIVLCHGWDPLSNFGGEHSMIDVLTFRRPLWL